MEGETVAWYPGVLRESSIPEFQPFKVDLSNLTDFYERSFKSESTIDPEKPRVPEKGRKDRIG